MTSSAVRPNDGDVSVSEEVRHADLLQARRLRVAVSVLTGSRIVSGNETGDGAVVFANDARFCLSIVSLHEVSARLRGLTATAEAQSSAVRCC
jgi:hypothetical protein